MRRRPPSVTIVLLALGLLVLLVWPAGCVSGVAMSAPQRQRAERFDRFWNRVQRDYPFLDADGVSWADLRDRYRPQAIDASSELAFHRTLWMLAGHLRDGHVSVEAPEELLASAGHADTGLTITRAYDGSAGPGVGYYVLSWPDAQAPIVPEGLDARVEVPQLLEVEGVPYHHTTESRKLFIAEPGQGVEVLLRWSDGTRTRHVLVARAKPAERDDDGEANSIIRLDDTDFILVLEGVRYRVRRDWTQRFLSRFDDERLVLGDGREATVARFRSVSLSVGDEQDEGGQAQHDADAQRAAAHAREVLNPPGGLGADALVLDLRGNSGGDTAGVRAVLGALLEPRAGLWFVKQGHLWHREALGGAPPAPPLVVLVNAGSTSGSELVASALQSLGGAVVVGAPTPGMTGAVYSPFNPPARAPWLTIPIAQSAIAGVPSVQRRGVTPDVAVLPTRADLRALRIATDDAPEPGRAMSAILDTHRLARWDRAIAQGVDLALQRRAAHPRDP